MPRIQPREADRRAGLDPCANRVENFTVFGKTTNAIFGEKNLVVRHDIEDALAALHEGRFDSECLLDLSRQTGSLGQVVSKRAVGDRDLHADSVCGCRVLSQGLHQSETTAEGYVDR